MSTDAAKSTPQEEDGMMETQVQEGESSGEDSAAEDDAKIEEKEADISSLTKQISQNHYVYENHPKRIQLLKDIGDLNRLRDAREEMSGYFPLTEELWLGWLQDEVKLVSGAEDRTKVEKLFERAFQDYMSVPVWLEYVQFAIGRMSEEEGVRKVREAFDRALAAVGLHVSQGANIWEAYREFEGAITAGLMPQPGAVVTKEQEDAFTAQNQRVLNLFKRQLGVPLLDMETTLKEYREWIGEDKVSAGTQSAFDKAKKLLSGVQDFENQLLRCEHNSLEVFQTYIQHELKGDDPVRILCVFERAIKGNCLVPGLWIQYTKYLDKLNMKEQICAAYERSLRNCTWSSQLWINHMLSLERQGADFAQMKVAADKALRVGFNEASDYLSIWSAYCDYLRRRIDWTADHEEQLETFQLTVESAVDFMFENYGKEGDPEGRLRQFWAFIEAKQCHRLDKAREIWSQLMQEGHGSEAGMWLQYYQLERAYGDNKHCRKLLQKALNSVTDWPESITQAYLNFEREEGTLEHYDLAMSKCDAQMERINERRAKVAEKESMLQEHKKKDRSDKKVEKKQQSSEGSAEVQKSGVSQKGGQGKRKLDQDTESFVKPNRPTSRPGEPAQKKMKEAHVELTHQVGDKSDHHEAYVHDSSKDNITVFVSNLDFSLEEDKLRDIFQKCGELTQVRLVRNYKGRSKGFGYVEFKDSNSVLQALRLDREFVDGRPIFVSRCEDRSAVKSAPQFKYATNLEKNKLFVKGLPFTITKEALETMFKEHGDVKDVRMVTYRNGRPKGIAYVEYDTGVSAAHAVMKMDGIMVGEHTISVDISNPPERKTQLSTRMGPPSYTPSLGGGKKETEFRGKARTQVSLVPRAVRQQASSFQPSATPSSARSDVGDANSKESTSETQAMSNADFRKMLLK